MTADETGARGAQDARGLGAESQELTHPSAPITARYTAYVGGGLRRHALGVNGRLTMCGREPALVYGPLRRKITCCTCLRRIAKGARYGA